MSIVIAHYQTADNAPLAGVQVNATSPVGDWSSVTDLAGNIIDPAHALAGINLGPGTYALHTNHPGYQPDTWNILIDGPGWITHALERLPNVLPAAPTRTQVCALRVSLQGLTYHTDQYGTFPAWFYPMLSAPDRASARRTHRAAGDTHITIPISEAYNEPGVAIPQILKEGYDWTDSLDTLRAVVTETVADGFWVDMPLAGDGLSTGTGYNDPVGRTYGYEWLLVNLPRIISSLRGDGTPARPDLTPYILFRPGWDAVFYGWGRPGEVPDQQPTRVNAFGSLFRKLLPNGYLAIEHTPGNIPCGEGGTDFVANGLMTNYDTILSEFNTVHEDSCWQVVGRMVSPYHRPADQPAGDDPEAPFYLAPGNPRGPYFYVAFEPTQNGAYDWVRNNCSLADVNATRDYLRSLGVTLVG